MHDHFWIHEISQLFRGIIIGACLMCLFLSKIGMINWKDKE